MLAIRPHVMTQAVLAMSLQTFRREFAVLGCIGSLSQNHIGVNAKFFQKIFLNRQVFCVFIIYNDAIQNILRKVPHRGHFISL